nr:MAG TPA: hypothetical protein [Caudoviricetes sp.]
MLKHHLIHGYNGCETIYDYSTTLFIGVVE